VLVEKDDTVIAHVAVIDRTIRIGDRPLRIAGIGNVFTLPEYRRGALYYRVMKTAMAEAERRDFDCGLLFCVPEIEKVYAFMRWQTLPDAQIVRIDENGQEAPIPGKNIAMFYPLKVQQFPPGRIHLQGNDW